MKLAELNSLYASMWQNAIHKFESNSCDLDCQISNPKDTRRGLTVLSYLDEPVVSNISLFLDELKRVEPEQYYYPQGELHLTILSIISCISGFKISSINVDEYCAIIKNALKNFTSFTLNFKGITVSSSCILIQGFPVNEQLSGLREALRLAFKQANVQTTIDTRYKISTAHLTAVRCVTPFRNTNELMALLIKYKDYNFGSLEVNSLDFVFNNWYQQLNKTITLSKTRLSSP